MKNDGLIIIVSSPSGGGKGSILKEYFKLNQDARYSVSCTTRAPRPGEIDGINYYFIDKDTFIHNIKNGEMIEYTEYVGNYYGTPKKPVFDLLDQGKDVVLEIEINGAENIKKIIPESVSIFILPPSMEILEKRLRKRGTESEDIIHSRLETAKKEIKCASQFDYVIVNDELEKAVKDFDTIIRAEKMRAKRNIELIERI